jgi:outer membrane protein W
MLVQTLAFTMILVALPLAADTQVNHWRLRFGGAWVEPSSGSSHLASTTADSNDDRFTVGSDGSIGFSLALERKFSRRFGLELGILIAEPDLGINASSNDGFQLNTDGNIQFSALTAGFNIHLTPDAAVDLYVGPLLVYTNYNDDSFGFLDGNHDFTSLISGNDNFTFGVQLGVDIPLRDGPWAVNFAARYIDSSLSLTKDGGTGDRLTFDPLILSAGFGYRF